MFTTSFKDKASQKQLMVHGFGSGIVQVTSVVCQFIPAGSLDIKIWVSISP